MEDRIHSNKKDSQSKQEVDNKRKSDRLRRLCGGGLPTAKLSLSSIRVSNKS